MSGSNDGRSPSLRRKIRENVANFISRGKYVFVRRFMSHKALVCSACLNQGLHYAHELRDVRTGRKSLVGPVCCAIILKQAVAK